MNSWYQQLQNIQVGDEIVLGDGYLHHPHWLHKVEKVTKTQLTVDGKRFLKNTGDMISSGDKYWGRSEIRIVRSYNSDCLLTWEDAEKANQRQVDKKECQALLSEIADKVKNIRNCSDVKGLEFVLEALNEVK